MAIDEILTEELTDLKARIISNMENAGAVASRRTIDSMRVEVEGLQGTLYGGKPTGAPFGTLETGRKAGAVPANFPLIIRQWMDDKGIHASPMPYVRRPSDRWQPKYSPQERGDMAMAGAIAHSIGKRGTRLHQEGGRDTIYSQEIGKTLESISNRILAGLVLEIDSIHRNDI